MKSSSLTVLGVVLAVMGSVFTLQGLGYLEGSPMTGATLWAVLGPVIAVVGVLLVVRGVRAGRSGRPG
jgi:drug/metabolite transporter superfamily protein YnfA